MEEPRHPSDATGQASALCQACALCCDGTLFSHVTVTPDEAELLKTKGVSAHPGKKEQPVISLGCTALKGQSCGIYDCRPERCRDYQCTLQLRVMNGEATYEEAHVVVQELKGHIADLRSLMNAAVGESLDDVRVRRLLQNLVRQCRELQSSGPLDSVQVQLLLRAFEVVQRIDLHFCETSMVAKYESLIQSLPGTGSEN